MMQRFLFVQVICKAKTKEGNDCGNWLVHFQIKITYQSVHPDWQKYHNNVQKCDELFLIFVINHRNDFTVLWNKVKKVYFVHFDHLLRWITPIYFHKWDFFHKKSWKIMNFRIWICTASNFTISITQHTSGYIFHNLQYK